MDDRVIRMHFVGGPMAGQSLHTTRKSGFRVPYFPGTPRIDAARQSQLPAYFTYRVIQLGSHPQDVYLAIPEQWSFWQAMVELLESHARSPGRTATQEYWQAREPLDRKEHFGNSKVTPLRPFA